MKPTERYNIKFSKNRILIWDKIEKSYVYFIETDNGFISMDDNALLYTQLYRLNNEFNDYNCALYDYCFSENFKFDNWASFFLRK